MKLLLTSSVAFLVAFSAEAFTPVRPTLMGKIAAPSLHMNQKSLDEEVEEMVQAELAKTRRMTKMRNANGVEYAPWMNISVEDEEKIRAIMREKAGARRKRFENAEVKGSLLRDSAFQELSGSGLKGKAVDGNCVELEWATGSEANSKGFLVKRRAAKTQDFEVIASYETYGPLASKGTDGGLYRYLDEDVTPGGWVYRVTECEANGTESDLSQCLVEVQTQEEQMATKIGIALFGVVAVAAVAAGVLLDPMQ